MASSGTLTAGIILLIKMVLRKEVGFLWESPKLNLVKHAYWV